MRGRRRDAGQPATHQAVLARAVLQDPGADAGVVRRRAVGAGQQRAHRAALQPAAHARRGAAARLSDRPTARSLEQYFHRTSHEGLERRLLRAVSGCRRARRATPALRRTARLRDRHHPQDGLRGLLPDRGRLHQLGAQPRLPGGAGARLGGRLAGGVFAEHHRPRPAALPVAVRALPESRAGVDARLRHRLLPGQPRARDRLRQAALRPRRGEPDRHLRHHGREGGAARRRPRARHGLRPRRLDRQADSGAAGQDGHAGQGARQARPRLDLCAQGGARAQPARGGRRRSGRAARAGHAGRRPGAQHRHACRRRVDRAGPHHRLLPAVPAARQRCRGEPVRQGRRRGDRPGEVRLPRPGDADDPRARQGLDRRAPSAARRLQLRAHPARRPGGVPPVRAGADRGGVPVRIARHAGHVARRAAQPAAKT